MRSWMSCFLVFGTMSLMACGQGPHAVITNASGDQQAILERPVAEAIRLPPPTSRTDDQERELGGGAIVTVTSSLAIVLGLFCGLVWITRKTGHAKGKPLPTDVFEVLGTANIDARHCSTLVRCGERVLLLSLSQSDIRVLCEFSDPNEVNRLLGNVNGESKQAFAEALNEVDNQSATGFVESSTKTRRELFSRDV